MFHQIVPTLRFLESSEGLAAFSRSKIETTLVVLLLLPLPLGPLPLGPLPLGPLVVLGPDWTGILKFVFALN